MKLFIHKQYDVWYIGVTLGHKTYIMATTSDEATSSRYVELVKGLYL